MSAVPSDPTVSVLFLSGAGGAGAPTERAARPVGLFDSWWTVGGAAVAASAAWAGSVWVSVHVQADASLHTAALFAHLVGLVLGFGAVLVADYHGLLWMTGRCTLREAVGSAGRLHLPIWAGLAVLVLSGMMLHPDPSATLTRIKLVLVLALTLNGLQAGLLNKRMAGQPAAPRHLIWGGATALISQICWWGAVVIGFLNSRG
ncbi:hypothetical protein [Streptomyces cinnamoneus]|uniref:hypothetical protein n=1 Tax=Streptomyces cinnamoneus TaxID=53446 RepID=UPI001E3332D3|nr:hypothetical protein [Streptomyces cinnamoneus]